MSVSGIGRREILKAGAGAAAGLALGAPLLTRAQSIVGVPLITRPIPSTGERLPVIGLGTNAWSVDSPEETAPLREMLALMPELGGSVVDTARAYERSEEIIGELVADIGNRERLFLASKPPIRGELGRAEEELQRSYDRLRVETLDLMLIHNLHGLDHLMPAFIRFKEQGRLRYIGMSILGVEQHAGLIDGMRRYPLDFIQVDYSIDNRDAADEVLPLAEELGIAVMINSPFGGWRGGGAAETFARVAGRELPDWAAEIDAGSWAQVFLKYVVSHPAVTVAIPGTTQVRHLRDNQRAGLGRLPDANLRRQIEQYWHSLG